MRVVKDYESEPSYHDEKRLHINPLEFIALIINLWFVIWHIKKLGPQPGGHVILLRADNTTALSWFRHAARCHSRPIRHLAYLAHAMYIFSGIIDYTQLNSNHIAGDKNVEADAISRPEDHPTLASAIAQYSRLQTCQPFLVPYGLLSMIVKMLSSPKIEATFEQEMIQVMNLAPYTSPAGYVDSESMPGYYRRQHRGKRSR